MAICCSWMSSPRLLPVMIRAELMLHRRVMGHATTLLAPVRSPTHQRVHRQGGQVDLEAGHFFFRFLAVLLEMVRKTRGIEMKLGQAKSPLRRWSSSRMSIRSAVLTRSHVGTTPP